MRPYLKSTALALAFLLLHSHPFTLFPSHSAAIAQSIPPTANQTAADRLLQQGTGEYETAHYEAALNSLRQALAIYQKVNNRRGEAQVLNVMGAVYVETEKNDKALETTQQALKLAREVGDRQLEGQVLTTLGRLYVNTVQNQKAQEVLEQSLAIAKSTQDRQGEGWALMTISSVYSLLDKPEKALELGQEAVTIARQIGDRRLEGRSLFRIGSALEAQKNYPKSIEVFQQGLEASRNASDLRQQYFTLFKIADTYYKTGNLANTQKALEQTLSIAQQLQDRRKQADLYILIGLLPSLAKNYRESLQYYQQALVLYRQIPDHQKEAQTLVTLAAQYNILGNAQTALKFSQQALALVREIDIKQLPPMLQDGLLETELSALESLKNSYSHLGMPNQALDVAKLAVTKARDAGKPKFRGKTLLNLANLYSNGFQDFPQAIALAQQALTIARDIKETSLEDQALQELSDIYSNQGDLFLARKSAEQLLAIAKQGKSPSSELDALQQLWNIYYNQGNYQKALESAQQYLALVRANNQEFMVPLGLMFLSQSYMGVGNPTKALEVAQQEITLAQRESNLFLLGGGLVFKSQALKLQGKYDLALETARHALEITHQMSNFPLEMSATAELGNIYEALGEYQNIIALAEPVLPRLRQLNNPVLEAEIFIIVGIAYGETGNYTKGKNLIEQGLAVARRLKNPALESRGWVKLGDLNSSLNNYQQALPQIQKSLQIVRTLPNPLLQIEPLSDLGDIYYNLGDYTKSAETYQKSLAIAQQFNNRYYEGIILLNLSHVSYAQGNPQKNVEFSQQALTIFQELKERRLEAFANRMLGLGYGELGDDAKAMASAQNFLAFARQTRNAVWEKNALSLIGSLHHKFGRKDAAVAAYQQAISIKTDEQTIGADAYNYVGLARIYRDLNQPGVAIGYYKQSLEGIESVRRNIQGLPRNLQTSFLESTIDFNRFKVSDIYRQLAELLLSQGRNQEAFQVQQLLRNQELREATGTRGADRPNIPLTPTETKIPAPSASIIALAKQIDECDTVHCPQEQELIRRRTALIVEFNQHLQEIDRQIRENRSKDDAYFNPQQRAKATEIVKAQPHTVMIYPLVLEKELWIQLYTGQGLAKTFRVAVSREELRKVVKEFRGLMEFCESGNVCDTVETAKVKVVSQKLYNWLLKDLEPELQNNQVENLVFALDRETRYIPMSALYDGKQYLIEKYTVHNILNDSYSKDDRLPPGTQNTPVLAMGTSKSVGGFRPLANVKHELDEIVKRHPEDKEGIYPGQEFLDDAFSLQALMSNLEGHKILHLATHGVFDATNPQASFILLGTGSHLTHTEIETMSELSDVQLVVLSACQTALGDRQEQTGIEINTLAYYFIHQGAKSVMASLWQVNDSSTAQLMQQFYSHLAMVEPMTKAQALREAQLWLLHHSNTQESSLRRAEEKSWIVAPPGAAVRSDLKPDLSHPYYWAPFILLGNGL